jgi:PAS domain S-box-containing protein
MTALQASGAALSIHLLSTVRAYVTGESLYSKGQKDAQIHGLAYAERHDEADYARFVSALAHPLGDRAAREALQLPVPDIAAAQQGFLKGGNHPDDIDGLIRMFRWFQDVPFMARPIATWAEGDRTIEQLRTLVERARERIQAGDPLAPEVSAMRSQAPILNERLATLTSAFSFQLGEASRTTQNLLLGLNAAIASLLLISGLLFVRRSVRLQAAAQLRMQRLIHAVTDGVVTVDEQRRVVLFNRAAEDLFGVDSATALGAPIDRFIKSSDGTPISLQSIAGSLEDMVGTRSDGNSFPLEASLSRLAIERSVLSTVVLRDVTAKLTAEAERRAHEALEASNKAKTEFLSRMSHELRTPLNAVLGFSKLLRMDVDRPLSLEQLARVQHVENAGAHLLALVNDVLDLARIESGEMSVLPDAVKLLKAVEEAATMVSPLVTEAGIEVFLVPATPAPEGQSAVPIQAPPHADAIWVKADAVRLRQVLVNLLSNAVKYNKPGGRVTLTWKVNGAQCEIMVVDTGCGIPAGKLESLFQPFNRLGAETSAVEGTGIGLVLSRQLTELMGGKLVVNSHFGEGTSVTLTLLLAEPPIVVPDHALNHRPASRLRRPLRVLYAEDNEVNAELVRHIVKLRRGVSLRIAPNGTLALEMARIDPPDLMLVDMNLGDMTGIELAYQLQSDRSTRDVRLVALSADALPEQIHKALESGFESYLTKPINFEELLTMLDKHADETFA